jgi:hypothetical protein
MTAAADIVFMQTYQVDLSCRSKVAAQGMRKAELLDPGAIDNYTAAWLRIKRNVRRRKGRDLSRLYGHFLVANALHDAFE